LLCGTEILNTRKGSGCTGISSVDDMMGSV
jgi:hypothetical protein